MTQFSSYIERLAHDVTRHWWVIVLRGVLAVALGAIALIWPAVTLLVLTLFIGAFALADGIFAGVGAFRAPSGRRGPLILECIAGLLFGGIALFWPGPTLLVLTIFLGAWALVRGIFAISDGASLPGGTEGRGWTITGGVISVVFGFLVMLWPFSGAVAVAIVMGVYALMLGAVMIAGGFSVRKLGKRMTAKEAEPSREQHGLAG